MKRHPRHRIALPIPQPAVERPAVPLADRPVRDLHGRPLRDLRLSVLDRCNLRCSYCMPEDALPAGKAFLPTRHLLTDDEWVRLTRVFTDLGVTKLRITGGEPLLRPGLPRLISRLAAVPGIRDLALTTNGTLLPRLAPALREAGLHRLTVSLDTLDEQLFSRLAGNRGSVAQVLAGIAAAEAAGFGALKINTVVRRGWNDHEVEALAAHFRDTRHELRLIEFMDVGNLNGWSRKEVVPSVELRTRLHRRWPLRPVRAHRGSAPAARFRYEDGRGTVGFISSITEPFCGACTRARVTADGTFHSCLFAHRGTLLRPLIRQFDEDQPLRDHLRRLWSRRADRYSELRGGDSDHRGRPEMFRVGG